jgi:uncharacterized glyoxalase superfamily protein PhnB
MSASQERQPTLESVAPRFLVGDMEQALAFYGQLGFATPYHDEGFAIVERDGIALQFNVSDPTQGPPKGGSVCYIGVTNIEGLYQQYLPTGAIRSPLPLQATPWGTKGFWLCDPFRDILIFEESIPEGRATRNKERKHASNGNRATERTEGRDSPIGWTTHPWDRARGKHRAQAELWAMLRSSTTFFSGLRRKACLSLRAFWGWMSKVETSSRTCPARPGRTVALGYPMISWCKLPGSSETITI